MWNFYDELCTGIPSGIRIEGCVVGKLWTTVRANGNLGVARTLGDTGCDRNALAQSFLGQFLRDAANFMRWGSLLHASVGVAAMNAFYNTASRLEGRSAPPAFEGDLGGKRVAVIGALPNLEAGLKDCCELAALPLPESGALDGAYDAALTGDIVFISGDALTNRTLPALLSKVGSGTRVSLVGVSVPAAPVLFAFGNPIHNLSGCYVKIPTTVEAAALQDLPNLGPGTAGFSVNPVQPRYLRESAQVCRDRASPYRSARLTASSPPGWAESTAPSGQ